MIDPATTITFAQYKEDLILSVLLSKVSVGFYVDVGASYPEDDSVTKLFYDKGWSGINIEPIKSIYQLLVKNRPRDININCGIGEKSGSAKFREYVNIPGHSTFDPKQKNEHKQSLKHKDYSVEIKTLSEIFAENSFKNIHFLKIDVEGYEQQVLEGNNWEKYRPQVVCIESNHAIKDFHKTMSENKYTLFIFDGLNDYYIANEHWGITSGFDEKIIKIDHFALYPHQFKEWTKDLEDLKQTRQQLVNSRQKVETLKHQNRELQDLATLSLKNINLVRRLKRAAFGLTIDWIKFKSQPKTKQND